MTTQQLKDLSRQIEERLQDLENQSQQLERKSQQVDVQAQELERKSQQVDNYSQQLESRIVTLEAELAQLKQLLANPSEQEEKAPWWVKVAGSFEDDPTFDEATRLGREWRQSAE